MYSNFYVMRNYFCHFAVKIFNRIPEEVRKLKNLLKEYKLHFQSNFYCFNK